MSIRRKVHRENPPLMIALGFGLLIVMGTILLMLPISSSSGKSATPLDAFFTAVSAVCVTGLVTQNTAVYWSTFGQGILLLLIQIGGLGFMTMTTMVFASVGRKMSFYDFRLIREQLNQETYFEIVPFLKNVFRLTFLVEAVGAVLLAIRFVPEYGMKFGVWASIFHSVSAFCNAGFDILGASLMKTEDPMILLTVSFLIIFGGIGFTVIADLKNGYRMRRFSLHTKVVLSISGILLLFGTLFFLITEYSNPATLDGKPFFLKLLHSFFQSTSARTAGFNSIDIGTMKSASAFVMIVLMFVGASPGSTGGGIKTTTAAVLMLSTISEVRGKRDIVAFRKRISDRLVRKSLAIMAMALSWVIFTTLLLSIWESADFLDLLFEATSAFGTVGISRNLTSSLGDFSKIILAFSMFAGRVGLMTIGIALSDRSDGENSFRYAEGNLPVG